VTVIGLAVSEVNGNYCLTVHSFTAEHMAKLPADSELSTAHDREQPPPDPLHRRQSNVHCRLDPLDGEAMITGDPDNEIRAGWARRALDPFTRETYAGNDY
jgi:hypothetical protein